MRNMKARQRDTEAFREKQAAWQTGQPRRCEMNSVGAAGECLACDAEQGVHCIKPAGRRALEKDAPAHD